MGVSTKSPAFPALHCRERGVRAGAGFLLDLGPLGAGFMLYCSLLYSYQFPAQVLNVARKPPLASADMKGFSLCYPVTTVGLQTFPLLFSGTGWAIIAQPPGNC